MHHAGISRFMSITQHVTCTQWEHADESSDVREGVSSPLPNPVMMHMLWRTGADGTSPLQLTLALHASQLQQGLKVVGISGVLGHIMLATRKAT